MILHNVGVAAAEFDVCEILIHEPNLHLQAMGLMGRLNSTEFAIEMDQRPLVRLKPDSFHSAKKYRVSSDHGFLDDFAIKHGECVDESGDTARHVDPPFFVEPLCAFDPGRRKQLSKVRLIMCQKIDADTPRCADHAISTSVDVHTED